MLDSTCPAVFTLAGWNHWRKIALTTSSKTYLPRSLDADALVRPVSLLLSGVLETGGLPVSAGFSFTPCIPLEALPLLSFLEARPDVQHSWKIFVEKSNVFFSKLNLLLKPGIVLMFPGHDRCY